MTARILAILFLLATLPAFADERPPRYDIDGLCSRLSNTPDGFSPETMARCLEIQSDAMESVRKVWQNTPDYIQSDCDHRARVDRDGDYQILDVCVRVQLRQEQADQAESSKGKGRAKPKPAQAKPAATPAPN